jgi:hypothetical protein
MDSKNKQIEKLISQTTFTTCCVPLSAKLILWANHPSDRRISRISLTILEVGVSSTLLLPLTFEDENFQTLGLSHP